MGRFLRIACAGTAVMSLALGHAAFATGDLHKVNHIIVVMQENHSYDNYLGVLAYAARGARATRGWSRATHHLTAPAGQTLV